MFLDRDATVDKACAIIETARQRDIALLVFPEAFVPAYPEWVWTVPAGERKLLDALYGELLANAVDVPGAAVARLCDAARRASMHVVMGVNERNVEASGASLYNTILFIDADGAVIGRHRKLMATGGERLVWTPGDGRSLVAYDTKIGRLGGLICWENYMPLARYAMYAAGTQIYVAPTWDHGEPWLSTLRHIAREGRAFVVGCSQALRVRDIPARTGLLERYKPDREWINPGESAIVDPAGKVIAGPLTAEEGLIAADVDLAATRSPRWIFDAAGNYARPDIFRLTINRAPQTTAAVRDDAAEGGAAAAPGRQTHPVPHAEID